MKIFLFSYELKTSMYTWSHFHYIDELQKVGHTIIKFNPCDYSSFDEANEVVLKIIRKTPGIDIFITCNNQDIIYKETIEQLKRIGIPTCLICWDNLELPYKQKQIAPLFDFVWITSIETKYLFEKWGCKNIIFQTYAANPFCFKPQWEKTISAVGFIGSPYGSRVNKINELIEARIPCEIYSDSLFIEGFNSSIGHKKNINIKDLMIKSSRYLRFPIGRKVLYSTLKNKFLIHEKLRRDSELLRAHRSVSLNSMIKLYSNFAMSLNITELRDTYVLKSPIHKIHLRAFEIPMSGGLQFASYTDEMDSYFKDNEEIILYKNNEEFVDKARFFLDPHNENIIKNIKKAARKRAENEHTWNVRFNNIFKLL